MPPATIPISFPTAGGPEARPRDTSSRRDRQGRPKNTFPRLVDAPTVSDERTGADADPGSSAGTPEEGRSRIPRSRDVVDTVDETLAGLRATAARQFTVDTRALAALRIALGGLLLADLVGRSRFLVFFYTDAGVLPRTALRAARPTVSSLSLHALWGGPTAQAVLFLLAAVAALALAAGYHARVAAVVS